MIGRRIKEQRQKLKWTQKELAEKVNVSSQVISNWERGYTTPNSDDVALLSKALDISSDYLLGHSNDPSPKKQVDTVNRAFHSLENLTEEEKSYLEMQLEIFRKIKSQKKNNNA
ncbi:hypothetical protein ACH33_07650 [Aneurinibacillus sp. XH2]|uniref:helix-turn-helix domain-containing protein n=1 Tax=Aneurinibacillus sp. XH2 TaxID=1450761 RepID=UPI00070C1BAD|nr:helix-turn-helix transcriptional regulator [Aneurinibacillus sp. XH2]AMA72738.1 hypothetical protein ACH33_07650 [Aneurinibacillus sp. XH2]